MNYFFKHHHLAWALIWLGPVACNNVHWPDPESIESLRVLGVRAEPPALVPEATSELSLRCADGSRGSGTDPTCQAEIAWFGECHNPARNDPENCFGRYAGWAKKLGGKLHEVPIQDFPRGFSLGPGYHLEAPKDILTEAAEVDGRTLRYGVSYVYFAVCGGELTFVPNAKEKLPVECRDPKTKQPLDHEHFVVGVTSVFSYDGITTQNPRISAQRIDRRSIPASCDADSACPEDLECLDDERCVPVVAPCNEAKPETCREHCFDFEVDPASFSLFTIAGERLESPKKSLWFDTFTNAGAFVDPDQVNLDPPSDQDEKRRTPCIRWEAPSKAIDQAHVWAVVRDNRGGLAVWDQPVIVR